MDQPDLMINADALRRSVKDIVAVAGASFRVHYDEIFGLLGPNDAGKTTTNCRLIGQNDPNRERAVIAGCDIVKDRAKLKERKSRPLSTFLLSDVGILILLALARVLLQIFTNGTYGFHQDELVTMDIATRHLAWGYVAWPPVTPFLSRVALAMFGLSPIGLRVFAVLAEGIVMLLTGFMIRDLGGGRWAQILGTVAVATSPLSIVQGGLFQYETFDYCCWVLLAFTVIRLLKTDDPRWWLGIGAATGLGMMTKYTIAFLVIGLVVGTLATRNRRYLKSRWLWGGVLLALLIWLPNLIWQFQNHWISLRFLDSIHTRDMQAGLTSSFLTDQLLL